MSRDLANDEQDPWGGRVVKRDLYAPGSEGHYERPARPSPVSQAYLPPASSTDTSIPLITTAGDQLRLPAAFGNPGLRSSTSRCGAINESSNWHSHLEFEPAPAIAFPDSIMAPFSKM